jgi:hypothetical protein
MFMKTKLTQRQVVVLTLVILVVAGSLAALKMVHSFQDRSNDRRQVINELMPPANKVDGRSQ